MDEENNGMDWAWLLMAMALSQSQNPPEQELPKDAFYCAQPMDLQNINRVEFDDFSIDQLRKATMNRKEAEKTRLDMLRKEYEKMITKEAMDTGHSINSLREEYEKKLKDESGYSGLFHFGDD